MNPYDITAKVGEGVTMLYFSDRHAGTIIDVSPSGKTVRVQRDTATLLNGPDSGEPDALVFHAGGFCGHMTGVQRYAYAPDPDGAIYTFTLRKNGRYVRKGESVGGCRLVSGRSESYDYNF